MSSRVTTKALAVFLMLIAATLAASFLARGAREPAHGVESDGPPAAAGDATDETFLGCLGQTGPNAFSLAVSRVHANDPLRIETYALAGSGGLLLSDHVGHTLDVMGALEEAGHAFPRLHVSFARHVADSCWRP